MSVAGMPRVVTLKSWDELKDVPVLDSRTGLPVNRFTMAKANAEVMREEAIATGQPIMSAKQRCFGFDCRPEYDEVKRHSWENCQREDHLCICGATYAFHDVDSAGLPLVHRDTGRCVGCEIERLDRAIPCEDHQ